MYKTVVLIEKQQKEKDKKKLRGKYSSITVSLKKFGLIFNQNKQTEVWL